jgi:hypothetical protein
MLSDAHQSCHARLSKSDGKGQAIFLGAIIRVGWKVSGSLAYTSVRATLRDYTVAAYLPSP